MKSKKLLMCLLLSFIMVGCKGKKLPNSSSSSSDNNVISSSISVDNSLNSENTIDNLENIKKNYGEFSITTLSGNKSYVLENNVLTLNSIDTYILKGYFEGKIVYSLDDTVAKSQTGIIELDGAFINSGKDIAIEWTSSKGTMEIKAKSETVSIIYSEGILNQKIQAIKGNNIDMRGKGTLFVYSKNHNAIKCEDFDIRNMKLVVEAKKNGLSCENATFKSGDILFNNCEACIKAEAKQGKENETGNVNFVCKYEDEPLNVYLTHSKMAVLASTSFSINYGTVRFKNIVASLYDGHVQPSINEPGTLIIEK